MRVLLATMLIAAAAVLAMPTPSAEADGFFFRSRAPVAAYYAPAPRRYYRVVAPAYYAPPARRWCLFDWFGWGRRGGW
jgi:hypothetical protein